MSINLPLGSFELVAMTDSGLSARQAAVVESSVEARSPLQLALKRQ